jgi:hypothetical protein
LFLQEQIKDIIITIHNEGSRAAPAHRLRITTLLLLLSTSPHTLAGVAAYMAKTFPDSDERLTGWYH